MAKQAHIRTQIRSLPYALPKRPAPPSVFVYRNQSTRDALCSRIDVLLRAGQQQLKQSNSADRPARLRHARAAECQAILQSAPSHSPSSVQQAQRHLALFAATHGSLDIEKAALRLPDLCAKWTREKTATRALVASTAPMLLPSLSVVDAVLVGAYFVDRRHWSDVQGLMLAFQAFGASAYVEYANFISAGGQWEIPHPIYPVAPAAAPRGHRSGQLSPDAGPIFRRPPQAMLDVNWRATAFRQPQTSRAEPNLYLPAHSLIRLPDAPAHRTIVQMSPVDDDAQ